uniref:Pectin acetylesterase n=1 Tax=Leersia perrieri TaxID=77586 RepID=A0A0D9VAX7_9ORYZ
MPPPPLFSPPPLRLRHAAAFALVLAAAFALFFLAFSPSTTTSSPPSYGHRLPTLVDLTLVHGAKEKGAVCLDGTPPGYHWMPGFGDGSDKWLLHLEGGSWCRNLTWCDQRKRTSLGSSAYMERAEFVGILSDDQSQNPDFYNWNKVKIRYCDGASFSGNVEEEEQHGTRFFFRGQRIWEAIMTELLPKGLARAKQAFLTGCSAGGLSTYIHCDEFRALLPKDSTVKCLADGGFFLDVEDISGRRYMRGFYNDVARLQHLRKRFPGCSSDMEPGQCFFPQQVAKSITTPMFILNPAYDVWQSMYCLLTDLTLKIYGKIAEWILPSVIRNSLKFYKSMKSLAWHSPSASRINNKTIAEAVGDWFFDRREVKDIDCEYPCNPTCYNVVLEQPYPEE